MLAYQHAYHAGNFADLHKHLLANTLAEHLLRKESPVTFIDTHAGRGWYPLAARETEQLREYEQGVLPVWQVRDRWLTDAGEPAPGATDKPLARWLARLADMQPESGKGAPSTLSVYPGSPWWLSQALRQGDRLLAYELHPGEIYHFDQAPVQRDSLGKVMRRQQDGLSGLLAAVPVTTPRVAVLIDPSYELKNDYRDVADVVVETLRKSRHATIMIWYPLLPAGRQHDLLERLKKQSPAPMWRSELVIDSPEGDHGMYGSGMLVINPPWQFDRQFSDAMQEVVEVLKGALPAPQSVAVEHKGLWWLSEEVARARSEPKPMPRERLLALRKLNQKVKRDADVEVTQAKPKREKLKRGEGWAKPRVRNDSATPKAKGKRHSATAKPKTSIKAQFKDQVHGHSAPSEKRVSEKPAERKSTSRPEPAQPRGKGEMAGKAAGKDSASWSDWSSSMPGKGRREGSTRVSKRSTPAIGRDGQVNSSSTTKLPRKYAARQRPEDTSDVGKPLDAREARALREKQEHNAMKGKATKGSPDKGQGSKPRGPRKP
ncbi:23S rRNA (adenine(2030)-N(6))-methyltransferase RlmJ [Cobetia marina]|uniref:23S rRNA (adenine(2030)-N(6))-methyltransferase RlmJ n=1 Tax=Cobetia marina TaxID=28258 RepID=UPI0038571794